MASFELISAVQDYEKYIETNGINEQVIDAYCEAANTAFANEKDIAYGLELSARCKEIIEAYCLNSSGGTIWDLEKYAFSEKVDYEIIERFYSVLLLEAQNKVVDSFFRYIEHKREPKERFYMPRRKQFLKIGLMDALQGMIDDKYDILCISLIPGAGKAQPLYSKILTPDGFIQMGDAKVGTKIIAGNGETANVIGIYPQGKRKIYEITLEDGSKCRCSDNHLWNVRYNYFGNKTTEKVIETKEMFVNPYKYLIPVTTKSLNNRFYLRVGAIQYKGEEECQCIMIDNPCHLYITDDYIITHNTTIEKFFNAAVIGWFPKDFNLFYSHSGDITRMYYDGVYDIVTNT